MYTAPVLRYIKRSSCLSGTAIINEVEVLYGISISPYDRKYADDYGYIVHLNRILKAYNICNLNCTSSCPYDPSGVPYVDDCQSGLISYIDTLGNNPMNVITIPDDGFILEPGVFYIASLVESISSSDYDFFIDNNLAISKFGVDASTDIFADLIFGMTVTHPTKVYYNMDIGKVQFI